MKMSVYRMAVYAVGVARRRAGENRPLQMLSLDRPVQRDEYVRALPVRQVQLCYIPLHPERTRRSKLSPWNVMRVPLYQRLEYFSL